MDGNCFGPCAGQGDPNSGAHRYAITGRRSCHSFIWGNGLCSETNRWIAQANALIRFYMESEHTEKKYYTLTFGTELVINPLYRQVHLKGRSIQLTRREFDLLYLLASRPGQVFSREQLYRHIWNTDTEFGVGEAVRFQIKSLRKKLTRTGSNYIQSVREIGYCFSGNP